MSRSIERLGLIIMSIVLVFFWFYFNNSVNNKLSESTEKGDTGTIGPRGERGPRGAQGNPGIKGGTGAPGLQGLLGQTGSNGLNGLQGQNGANGIDGVDGSNGSVVAVAGGQDPPKAALSGGGPPVYGLDGNGTSGSTLTVSATWPASATRNAILTYHAYNEWQVGVPLSGPGLIRLQLYGAIRKNGVDVLPIDMASTGFDVSDTWSLAANSPDVFIASPGNTLSVPPSYLTIEPGDTITMVLIPSTEILTGTFIGQNVVYGAFGSIKLDPAF